MDCKARLPCTVRGLFDIYGIQGAATSEKFFEIFSVRSRKTSDERRSNLVVVRSEDAKSDEEIAGKMKKKSSLKFIFIEVAEDER